MAAAAGIGQDNRNKAKIGAVANRRVDTDLRRYPADDETLQTAVAHGDRQRRAFERREGDLVENGFILANIKFRRKRKTGAVAQEPRFDIAGGCLALPGHHLLELKHAGHLFRQGHMAHEEDADTGGTRDLEGLQHLAENGAAVLHLLQYADLHVINDQRRCLGPDHFGKSLRNGETIDVLHEYPPNVSGDPLPITASENQR